MGKLFKKLIFAVLICYLGSTFAWATPEEGIYFRQIVRSLIRAAGESPEVQRQVFPKILATHPELFAWAASDRDWMQIIREADLDSALPMELKNKSLNASDFVLPKLLHPQMEAFQKLNEKERLAMLSVLPAPAYTSMAQAINEVLNRTSLVQLEGLQKLFASEHGLKISQVPADKAKLLLTLMRKYFDKMPLPDKREIVAAVLSLPPHSPLEAQLAEVVQNSGPVLQKFLQLFRESDDPGIQKVLKQLLSNIRPIPREIAQPFIEAHLGKTADQVFSSIQWEKPKSGTVGQVYFAKLRSTGEEVVIKFLRPGVREHAAREIKLLRELTRDDESLRELVDSLESSILPELDLIQEDANMTLGVRYADASKGLATTSRVREIPGSSDLLVLKKARGTNMSQEVAAPLERQGQAIANLLEKWFDRAIYGDGFLHADLHPGNLFYEELSGGAPNYLLTVIDFGSTAQLTPAQQKGFIHLSIAIVLKSSEKTLAALREVSELPDTMVASLSERIKNIYLSTPALSSRLSQVLMVSLDSGLKIPSSLLQLNRGRLFLETALAEINRKLDASDPDKKLRRFSPTGIYAKISLLRLLADAIPPSTGPRAKNPEERLISGKEWKSLISENRNEISDVVFDTCAQLFSGPAAKPRPTP